MGRVDRLRHCLQHRHLLRQIGQLFERAGGRQALRAQLVDRAHQRHAVAGGQRLDDAHPMTAVDRTQHLAHGGLAEVAAGVGDGLVGERQRVAHRAARATRQQPQRRILERHRFGVQHCLQVLEDGFGGHRPQVELQAAAQHRHRHLLRIGGGEHELQVLGRLLERLQHRVEGGRREHVHLVDHVDLEAPHHRLVDGLIEQLADLVDTAVRRRIELDGVDVAAGAAHATWRGGDAAQAVGADAVQALGQDARDGGLADAAGAGEQVGVVQTLLRQGIAQGLHDVRLPHQLGEAARAVLAGQDDIGHGEDSRVPDNRSP